MTNIYRIIGSNIERGCERARGARRRQTHGATRGAFTTRRVLFVTTAAFIDERPCCHRCPVETARRSGAAQRSKALHPQQHPVVALAFSHRHRRRLTLPTGTCATNRSGRSTRTNPKTRSRSSMCPRPPLPPPRSPAAAPPLPCCRPPAALNSCPAGESRRRRRGARRHVLHGPHSARL